MRHTHKLFFLFLLLFASASGSAFSESSYLATEWQNPDNRIISTQPLGTFQTGSGVYCREFQQTIFIGNREEAGYGTACRQPDGQWQIVDPDTIQERTQPSPSVQIGHSTPSNVRIYSTPPRIVDSYSYYSTYPGHLSVSLRYVELDRKGMHTRKYYSKNDHRSGDNWCDCRDRHDWRDQHDRNQGKWR